MRKKSVHMSFLKKKWYLIALCLIVILGFSLRVYHADYPVIGYHNQKETHTLSEARNFYEDGFSLVNKKNFAVTPENPYLSHADNLPLFTLIISTVWKISGVSLLVARIITILFSIGSLILSFFTVKLLFKRNDIALLTAFLVAIMPLLVFFGRNVQFDVPALFFMMLSLFFFLKWKEEPKYYWMMSFGFSFLLAGLSKYFFMIILFPILAIFPYERLITREGFAKYYKQYVMVIFSFLVLFFGWIFISKFVNSKYGLATLAGAIPFDPKLLKTIFISSGLWKTIYSYAVVDNFTFLFLMLAFVGILFAVFNIKKDHSRFIFAYFISFFIYVAAGPVFLNGHNYYQIPFGFLIALSVSYFVIVISDSIKAKLKFKQKYILPYLLLALIILINFNAIKLSTTRQFDTQFFGLDVAGEYVRLNSDPSQLVMGSGHQDSGFYWHSNRRMTEPPKNLSEFKQYEEGLNIQWLFIYQWGFNEYFSNPEIAEYVSNNYHLSQIGLLKQGTELNPAYFVLNKGGSFNLSDVKNLVKGKPIFMKKYSLTSGTVELDYINI